MRELIELPTRLQSLNKKNQEKVLITKHKLEHTEVQNYNFHIKTECRLVVVLVYVKLVGSEAWHAGEVLTSTLSS